MSKGIKITSDNFISVVDLDMSNYINMIECIDCSMFEVVGTELMYSYFHEKVVMVMDEEALIKGLPVNQFGSFMYGTIVHGHPICGDIVLMIRELYELVGFECVEYWVERLLDEFPFLKRVGDSDG